MNLNLIIDAQAPFREITQREPPIFIKHCHPVKALAYTKSTTTSSESYRVKFAFLRFGTPFTTFVIYDIISRAQQSRFKHWTHTSVRMGNGQGFSGGDDATRLVEVFVLRDIEIDLSFSYDVKTLKH